MSRASIISKSQSTGNLNSKQANGKSQATNPPPTNEEEVHAVAADRRHALTLSQKRTTGESNLDAQEEKKKDYRKEFSEKLVPLKLPRGLQQKNLMEDPEKPLDSVQQRLVGLPGKLQLDLKTTQKYFGDTARDKFFHRYQWLSDQRLKIAKSSSEELDRLYFEEYDEGEDDGGGGGSIPFAPKRPVVKSTKGVLLTQSEVLNEDDEDDHSTMNEEEESAMLEELRIKGEREAAALQANARDWGKGIVNCICEFVLSR
ncbi:hypothetical protein EON65_21805 [archaeon]|nr:MAG: hypothetical protein EON65_21805 [archaeon]